MRAENQLSSKPREDVRSELVSSMTRLVGWGVALVGWCRRAVLARITAHVQAADSRGEECKWVTLALVVVEVATWASRSWAVGSRLESGLSGTAIERAGRVSTAAWATESEVACSKAWVWAGGSTEAGWQSIGALWSAILLATVSASTSVLGAGRKGGWAGSTGHRSWTHSVTAGAGIHRRWESSLSNNNGSTAASTATKAADVLGKVVVTTALGSTLPVTSAEWNNATSAHSAATMATSHTSVVVVAHVWWHHALWTIAVAATVTPHGVAIWSAHSWERAAEARSATLEVGESAGWAGPVSWTWAVLGWWERSQDLGSTVKNTAGRWRDLDGLLVERPAVHAERLGSLFVY